MISSKLAHELIFKCPTRNGEGNMSPSLQALPEMNNGVQDQTFKPPGSHMTRCSCYRFSKRRVSKDDDLVHKTQHHNASLEIVGVSPTSR